MVNSTVVTLGVVRDELEHSDDGSERQTGDEYHERATDVSDA